MNVTYWSNRRGQNNLKLIRLKDTFAPYKNIQKYQGDK